MNTRLKIPVIDFKTMFDNCTDNIRDTEKRSKARIIGYKADIEENRKKYITNMKSFEIFEEKFSSPISSAHFEIFKKDMSWLYTNKYVKKNGKGRQYYDLIKSNVKNNRCPYCLHFDIEDLDHYLPKSVYPSLSLTTENLIPACKTCNTKKSESKDLFPHPYFDEVDNYVFIKCNIVFGDTDVEFVFEINEEDVPVKLLNKIENFAEITGMLEIYSTNAKIDFNMRQNSLMRSLNNQQSLEYDFQDMLDGAEQVLGKNCWQAAFYRELLEKHERISQYLKLLQLEKRLS
ncbi:HNH endonuclease [Jeotgalicoccus aerolatus]|uniref:HNH endonuclease n=1 Tax=Jeotgalicoccus aerolatus TaxID=709510 RepID=A0A1G8V5W8_9STAP|nr:HNH endonuclease [Jeotgalicoccus aerolatus]SDJ61389.1 HNH endonuclease [Jeotgalicoccus aerolatus]